YLVAGGLQGRLLESESGARAGAELEALVEHALRIRNLMAFVPNKYDRGLIEAMALAGAFDPSLDAAGRAAALTAAAARLQMGDREARWSAELRGDGSATLHRLWRGVTDVHEIEGSFIDSAEARKLHRLASENADVYATPSRLVKGSAESDEDSDDTGIVIASDDDAITRPTQLLDAVLAAGRKGLSSQRYKGLGEMNAEQLWETTLDPDNRALLQVKVEDADVTDEIFTRLMGDVVEPRREFIQDNALNVANLDV
ncbi:MAG: DNA gyrase subunit B, partial [Erythrobacter sp. 34-65-8]